nr:hypothetical protein Itr_chr12CG10990 [Ipomoea trifida]
METPVAATGSAGESGGGAFSSAGHELKAAVKNMAAGGGRVVSLTFTISNDGCHPRSCTGGVPPCAVQPIIHSY